jgi:uncharacterized protein (UPF0303 family)
MLNIDNKFNIGQIVYVITDKEQEPRIVVAIEISNKDLLYKVCHGVSTSEHYDFELSEEVDLLVKTT